MTSVQALRNVQGPQKKQQSPVALFSAQPGLQPDLQPGLSFLYSQAKQVSLPSSSFSPPPEFLIPSSSCKASSKILPSSFKALKRTSLQPEASFLTNSGLGWVVHLPWTCNYNIKMHDR